MTSGTVPNDLMFLEPLARIIDRARADNSISTEVSWTQLSSDLENLLEEIFSTEDATEGQAPTSWDMIAEEVPEPDRRYRIFAEALVSDDPLAKLRALSRDRSPSELYLLEMRIKSFASSKRPNVEKTLLDLTSTKWSDFSAKKQANIRKHMEHLHSYYYSTQKRNTDQIENRINLAVHALAELFARQTHFDGIPTDLPYAPTSRFVEFLCLALAREVHPGKLSPEAVSMRWRRLKGPSDTH